MLNFEFNQKKIEMFFNTQEKELKNAKINKS